MTIEDKIDYYFKKKDLLKVALTHSSHSGDFLMNNERLEFLGDAVLELIISEHLFLTRKLAEGKMTKIRSNIVCAESLSKVAHELNFGNYIYMGRGEEVTGGRNRRSNLANTFEAVIGAIFLDSDFETTKKVVLKLMESNIRLAQSGTLIRDYKTELQESLQKYGNLSLEYVFEGSEGPEHNKTFHIKLVLNGECVSHGTGKSKKEGEQDAAKNYMHQKRKS